MRREIQNVWIVLALLAAFVVPAFGANEEAEESETLKSFRAAFEKRMNQELDEHGNQARNLREKYIEALKRLKSELGKDEKLKEAAQVVAEIEAVEDGEEAKDLPEDTDLRFKNVRKKWEDGLEKILQERAKKIEATAMLYFKALDSEKRKLTRGGKIKEALQIEEEEKRVRELPEVKAVMAQEEAEEEEAEKIATVRLAKLLTGTKWSYLRRPGESGAESTDLSFLTRTDAVFGKSYRVEWKALPNRKVRLTRADFKSPVVLELDDELKSFTGTASDGAPVRGRRLNDLNSEE